MLTDKQIKGLIEQKKVTIEPYKESSIRAGKYDITLGRYILIPTSTSEIIDPSNPIVQPEYSKLDLSEKDFILEPGMFVLGQTHEVIGLASDIGILLDGSSTMARLGISIHISSFFIPPGQDPHIITLEIYNAGPWKVKLSQGLRVGKLLFFQYSEENEIATKTFNRYNGQKEASGAKITIDNKN